MATQQEVSAFTQDESKALANAQYKAKLAAGKFNDAAYKKVFEQNKALATQGDAGWKDWFNLIGTGAAPTEKSFIETQLKSAGVNDFSLTPYESALLKRGVEIGQIEDPGLQSFIAGLNITPGDYNIQAGFTGRTFDPQGGQIYGPGGQQVDQMFAPGKQIGPKSVSQTGSLAGTMGVAGAPQAPQAPQVPTTPQQQYGQILTLPNGQRIDPRDPNYKTFANQLGIQQPAQKEEVIIQGKTGYEGLDPSKKTNIDNGLNAAWERIQAGTPGEKDQANIDYAKSIGIWSEPDITDGMSEEEKDLYDAEQAIQGNFNLPNLLTGTPYEGLMNDYTKALSGLNKGLTDTQNKILETISAQPGNVEMLTKLKQDFGQQALIDELTKLSKAAQPLEDALETLPQDIADRYEDIGLNESQRKRRLAIEAVPLTQSLNKVMQAKQVTLDNLKFNSNEIGDIMSAALADQEKEGSLLMQQLEFASDNVDLQQNILKTQFDLALSSIQSQLETQNPEIMTVKEEDAQGNVTVVGIDKFSGEKVWEQNLGSIAKGFKSTGGGSGGSISGGTAISLTKSQLNQAKGNYFSANPDATETEFNNLSNESKYSWYQGGPEEGSKQFLSKDYFSTVMTKDQLKEAAKDAGFTKGGFLGIGVGEEGINDYLSYLEGIINQYRNAGYTDQEILKLMQ